MRKIVDSNFLRREGLRQYLAKSTNNYAVLTDYAAMEAYKGDSLVTICKSMEILSEYPRQVLVLRGTQTVCGLRYRAAGLQRRMIDQKQTRGFAEYCHDLREAKAGNIQLQERVLRLGHEAEFQMHRILADAAMFPEVIEHVSRTYTGGEIALIRARGRYTPELIERTLRNVCMLAAGLFRDHPRVARLPTTAELPNSFVFRFAVCAYLLALTWISVGGADGANAERIRNDLVDANFATYATFFDGILTNDRKLLRIHSQVKFLLESLFSEP